MDKDIAARLRRLREEDGLTQETLAGMAGVSPGFIDGIESGKIRAYDDESARNIAYQLRVESAYLRCETEIDLLQKRVSKKDFESELRIKKMVRARNAGAASAFDAKPSALLADKSENIGLDYSQPPAGYVRLEHLSHEPSMGSGSIDDELVPVVRHIDVWEQWVRQNVGSVHPERIKVLTARGRSMMPTIQDHDLVFVDVWQRNISDPGIYVIDVGGRLLLKKALIQANGTLILRSDNEDEYKDEERHDLKKSVDTIHVSGRVLAWWTLRRG